MPNKKIVIIGAGIAGLSAGCYAQMNGYDSCIYELHDKAGGLCTSWKRGDYIFDGCLDWLTGSSPGGLFYSIWEELGAVQGVTFHYEKEYCRYVCQNGHEIVLYLDADELEQELTRSFPDDQSVIHELCTVIRRFRGFRPNVDKAMETMGPLDYCKMMADVIKNYGQYNNFFKYGSISMEQFASKFKNADLREMFSSIWVPCMPVSLFASTMAWCAEQSAGYPIGGSLAFSQKIEQRYLGLGGQIHYKKRVESIVVKDGKASGIRLEDGSMVSADIVICAADLKYTIDSMLDGKYQTDMVSGWLNNKQTFPAYIQISLGVNRDMRNIPRLHYWKMDTPMTISGQKAEFMIIHNYSFDETLSTPGKTPLVIRFLTDYNYWQELQHNPAQYREEKKAMAEDVINRIDKLFPGIKDQIEVIDVATPTTYVRYTNTWKGATMSWLPTTENFGKSLPKTLAGLQNFYLVGQWLVPGGGVPNALKTARDAVQMICKNDSKRFVTTKP